MRSPSLVVLGRDGKTWSPALYSETPWSSRLTHTSVPVLGPVSAPCVLRTGYWFLSSDVTDSSPLSAEQCGQILGWLRCWCWWHVQAFLMWQKRVGQARALPDFKGNWSLGGISRRLLAFSWRVFPGQERCDIIQHERFLLLAIWSLQFC